MKKTLYFLSFIFIVSVFSSTAYAQSSRIYISGYMGLNTYGDNDFNEDRTPVNGDMEFKNAISLAGALGIRLTRKIRVEGEVSYRKTDLDNMDITAGSFKIGGQLKTLISLINGYYDFDLGWRTLNPFLSAGLGLAWHDAKVDDIAGVAVDGSGSDMGLAWQVGGGMKLRVNNDMAITGGYRYLATGNIGFENYELDFSSHELRLGLEYDIPIARR